MAVNAAPSAPLVPPGALVSQVTDNLFIGTQPDAGDYARLRERGVRLVINMRSEFEPPAHEVPGVDSLWLRTTDTPFTPIPIAALVRGTEAALKTMEQGGKVFVHCAYGRHRSVAMTCAVLIAQGRSADAAMDLIEEKHPRADPRIWYIRSRIRRFEQVWWKGGAPPFEPAKVRGLLFDLDGTLADTDDAYIQRISERLRRAAFLFPRRDPAPFLRLMLRWFEGPLGFLLTVPDRLGFDVQWEAASARFRRLRTSNPAERFLLLDGVKPMLERVAQVYPLGLVTSRSEEAARAFLDQYELGPYFKTVVTVFSARRMKPHPAPIRKAAEELELPAECLAMVGDTTVDILAARRAGAQAIGVLCGFGDRHELEGSGANLILNQTAEVGNW